MPGGLRQDVVRMAAYFAPRAEQDSRIEVALDCLLCADGFPRGAEADSPIHADDVTAQGCNLIEDCGAARAEINDRYPRLAPAFDELGVVGRDKFRIIARAKRPRPRVEK